MASATSDVQATAQDRLHASAISENEVEQDDDGEGDAEKPKKNTDHGPYL
jgi:hypothetical protein